MSYTPPNTFVSGTPVEAEKLQENFNEFNFYQNRNIVPLDFSETETKFNTQDIVKGEYFGVTTDHQFTTGNLYTQVKDSESQNRSYVSSHWKNRDLGNETWQVIPNTSKKIIPELGGYGIYTVSVSMVVQPNFQLISQRKLNWLRVYISKSPTGGTFTNGQLAPVVSPDLLNNSKFTQASFGGSFTEDWAMGLPPHPQPVDTLIIGDYNSGWEIYNTYIPTFANEFKGFGNACRRWYVHRYMFTFNAGEEFNIGLATNCVSDKGYISARNANVELFYTENNIPTPGYEPVPPENAPIPT